MSETTTTKRADVYALTGGMGSGKSTTARRFEYNGAKIVDADQVVHDLQAPGMPMLDVMAHILGDDIVVDGVLDRAAVAAKIFTDADSKAAVQAAINPAIFAEIERRVLAVRSNEIVIYDTPLLNPAMHIGRAALTGIIVVDVPEELAIERLQKYRGVTEVEARRRLAQQISREERLAFADYVIHNTGTQDELYAQTDEVWRTIRATQSPQSITIGGAQ